jgi:MOSC domain-containing protein YiiM
VLTDHPVLASIQVGPPRTLGWEQAVDQFDRPWVTGIFKHAVEGPVTLGRINLAGDAQADLVNHGGADKAICAYSADHYEYWRRVLGLTAFGPGAFGENFTIRRLTEADVCIGDVYALGDVRVQVSQPRQPCWKLARRWRIRDFAAQVVTSGRTGWYFRVLEEGVVSPGIPIRRLERPHPEWSVAAANLAMHGRPVDVQASRRLAAVPPLSNSWKAALTVRASTPPP